MVSILHVLNRGVDKRKIFMDERDYFRFVHDLFEFNDTALAKNQWYYLAKRNYSDVRRHYILRRPRELLVDILAFCLMPNHYHLLLQPRAENGVPLFIKKLNGGYAKYFNERHERAGALFQGKYKSIDVTAQSHFLHLPYYIHCNPLDLASPEWREQRIRNLSKAKRFLEFYRWSSHLDYLGKRNFPSVTQRGFLLEFFGGTKKYQDRMDEWLNERSWDSLEEYTLE